MIERFDPADPRWDALQTDFHVYRYEFAKPHVKAKTVLDVACGTGFGSKLLLEAPAAKVTGVDRDLPTIERARREYAGLRISFEVADAEDLRFDEPFDVVVSFETIEHLDDAEAFLRQVRRVLRTDGLFIVSSPVRQTGALSDPPANPFHVREWTMSEFSALLGKHFKSVEVYGQWFSFRRGPFPMARTLKSWASAVLQPSLLPSIHNAWPKPIPRRPPFSLTAAYMVAVCQ